MSTEHSRSGNGCLRAQNGIPDADFVRGAQSSPLLQSVAGPSIAVTRALGEVQVQPTTIPAFLYTNFPC